MTAYTTAEDITPDALAALSDYSPLLQKLLARRGITDRDTAQKFLHPDYDRDTHDPFLLKDMERAVARVRRAMEAGEYIIIYADYDCDGIPGAVVLNDLFLKLGYTNFEVYIPHRHEEGYGVHLEAIEQFAKNDASLVITVDCGITDSEEVARANELGVDVIITDHHLPPEALPQAHAIVNPKQHDDTYPDDGLAGAGVAFKLAHAVITRMREEEVCDAVDGWEKWLLDMAGLATIADMVPLTGENRVLATFGLTVLQKSRRPGLRALLKKIRVNQTRITEDDVGFMIAPRINAASRMDVPIEAFRLLATTDTNTARELTDHLHRVNETRKGLVASMIKEAHQKLKTRDIRDVIVVGNPEWRPGVLGLVASRLTEEYGRPAFVWGRGEAHTIKGSCRSDGSVNIVELMHAASENTFIEVGGHAHSGGFSVSHDKIHTLEEEILNAHQALSKEMHTDKVPTVEAELTLSHVNESTLRDIEKLAPFGIGNPKPVFLVKEAVISRIEYFGKQKQHLKLVFEKQGGSPPARTARAGTIEAIAFFTHGSNFTQNELKEGSAVNILATLERSFFSNGGKVRLRIVDVC